MHTVPQLYFKTLSYHSLVDHNKLFLVAFVGTTMKPSDPLVMNPQPQCGYHLMSNHLYSLLTDPLVYNEITWHIASGKLEGPGKHLDHACALIHNKLLSVAFVGTTMTARDPLTMNPQPLTTSFENTYILRPVTLQHQNYRYTLGDQKD